MSKTMKKEKKQSMRNKKTSPIHLGQLISYLKQRSVIEKVPFTLNDEFFITLFNIGIRTFFGVTVNEDGFPINDEQQPTDFFYDDFLSDYYLTIIGIKNYQH